MTSLARVTPLTTSTNLRSRNPTARAASARARPRRRVRRATASGPGRSAECAAHRCLRAVFVYTSALTEESIGGGRSILTSTSRSSVTRSTSALNRATWPGYASAGLISNTRGGLAQAQGACCPLIHLRNDPRDRRGDAKDRRSGHHRRTHLEISRDHQAGRRADDLSVRQLRLRDGRRRLGVSQFRLRDAVAPSWARRPTWGQNPRQERALPFEVGPGLHQLGVGLVALCYRDIHGVPEVPGLESRQSLARRLRCRPDPPGTSTTFPTILELTPATTLDSRVPVPNTRPPLLRALAVSSSRAPAGWS